MTASRRHVVSPPPAPYFPVLTPHRCARHPGHGLSLDLDGVSRRSTGGLAESVTIEELGNPWWSPATGSQGKENGGQGLQVENL